MSRAQKHPQQRPQEGLSRTDFADLIMGELEAYYASMGTRFERLFFFPGQDAFRHDSPADAIAALYWGLPKPARLNMTQGLIDVLAARMESVSAQALVQVVLSIGLIHDVDLLRPLVKVVGQRCDEAEDLHAIYSSTVAVIVGFGPVHAALEAASELSNFQYFPDDLAYDVLEFLVRDPATQWNQSVTQLLPRMEADYKPAEYARIKERLSFVAAEIGSRVGLKALVNGLLELIGQDAEHLSLHRFVPRRDPLGILLTELFLEPNAPFVLNHRPSGALAIASQDGRQNLTVDAEPAFRALALAESSAPVSFPFLSTVSDL